MTKEELFAPIREKYNELKNALEGTDIDRIPKAASTVNTEMMSVEQIHQKLEKGYADIAKGNVEDAASAFAAFRERH